MPIIPEVISTVTARGISARLPETSVFDVAVSGASRFWRPWHTAVGGIVRVTLNGATLAMKCEWLPYSSQEPAPIEGQFRSVGDLWSLIGDAVTRQIDHLLVASLPVVSRAIFNAHGTLGVTLATDEDLSMDFNEIQLTISCSVFVDGAFDTVDFVGAVGVDDVVCACFASTENATDAKAVDVAVVTDIAHGRDSFSAFRSDVSVSMKKEIRLSCQIFASFFGWYSFDENDVLAPMV